MSDAIKTPLQIAIGRALANAPEARDHYDRLLQQRFGTKGKPIYDIERGKSRKPSGELLAAIADMLNIPLGQLAGAVAEPGGAAPDLPTVITSSDGDGSVYLRQVDLAYSMGPGSTIDDYPEEGLIQFDANLLRSITRSPPERLYVARGSGDSMFPTLINDDMVVIDTLQRTLNMQDRIWAISLHGAGGIKRLRASARGKVEVISDNPAVSNQEADAEDLFIAGRVIWVGRRV